MKSLVTALVALSIAVAVGFTSSVSGAEDAASPAARTVILVRHAEKDAQSKDARDPSLSAAGQARAEELARLLGASGATKLYTSELKRTRETLAPLAAKLGVASEALPAAKSEAVVSALDALPAGSVAVVCGHSNTIPRVAELLGAKLTKLVEMQGMPMIEDAAFDRVFVVTRPATGPATCVELNYGAAPATQSSGK